MDLTSAAFWAALGSIIWVNILLSGDNAVVIALAARSLPPQHQKKAIFWGSAAAIVMRIGLTVIALEMLKWPYLKIVGGLLLLYIGTTLLVEEDDGGDQGADGGNASVMVAIRTILIADLVMSLDNVIAVAAAAKGDFMLLIIGLAMSIPLVIFGSTLLIKVIERFPFIVWLGAALLGFIAGEIVVEDPALKDMFHSLGLQFGITDPHRLGTVMGVVGAVVVVIIGKVMLSRRSSAHPA